MTPKEEAAMLQADTSTWTDAELHAAIAEHLDAAASECMLLGADVGEYATANGLGHRIRQLQDRVSVLRDPSLKAKQCPRCGALDHTPGSRPHMWRETDGTWQAPTWQPPVALLPSKNERTGQ